MFQTQSIFLIMLIRAVSLNLEISIKGTIMILKKSLILQEKTTSIKIVKQEEIFKDLFRTISSI